MSTLPSIAVVAPSSPIAPEFLEKGVQALRDASFPVEVLPGVYGPTAGSFAASDSIRARDLSEALTNPNYDVVWCTRGGYGAVRAVQMIAPPLWTMMNKIIVGFSDITVLHSLAVRAGHASILGPMMKHIARHGIDSPDVNHTISLLLGDRVAVSCRPMLGSREGSVRAKIVGGNLSIIYSLRGTPAEVPTDGNILFIEDVGEPLYHIDRMMQNLKYSGALSRLAGIIVGQMTDIRDGSIPFGRDAYQIVADAVADYKYPVLLGYPSGHDDEINEPVLLGREALLDVRDDHATLSMCLDPDRS